MAFEDVALDAMRGVGLWKGLGTSGLRRAPLNFIIKKKHPRNTPCGIDPGRDLGEDVTP